MNKENTLKRGRFDFPTVYITVNFQEKLFVINIYKIISRYY